MLSRPFNYAAVPVCRLRRSRTAPPIAWGADYEDVPLVETRASATAWRESG